MKSLKVGESVNMNGAEKLKTFHSVSKMINNSESYIFKNMKSLT